MAVTGAVTSHQGPSLGGAATGNLGPVMQEEWSDEITSLFSNEALLMQMLDDGVEEDDWDGEFVVEPLHTGRNRSGGPGRETDNYPDPGSQGYNQLQIGTAFYRTMGQITSKAMKVAEKGNKSKVRALQADIQGAVRDLVLELGIDFYYSSAAILAVANAAMVGAVATFHSILGAGPAGGPRLAEMAGTRYLSGGRTQPVMFVAMNEANGAATFRGRSTVTTVDSRIQATFAANIAGVVDGDVLMRAPSSAAGDNFAAVANDLTIGVAGLDQIYDDGTTIPAYLDTNYFGINKATNALLDGFVRNLAGAEVDEPTLQDTLDAIADTGGEVPDAMLMHRSVRTRVARNFIADRRFVPQKFPGGWKGEYLVYNPGDGDIGVWVDRLCPYRTIYFLNRTYLKKYVLAPAHLVNYGGSALRQTDAPVWRWAIEADLQLACTKPNSGGKLIDVASDPTYGRAGFLPAL